MIRGVAASTKAEPKRVSLTELKGVSDAVADRLEKLGLRNVQDLLFHLPLRYEDRTRLIPVGALQLGRPALVAVTVDAADVVFRRRRTLLVKASDGSGSLLLRFFYFSRDQQAGLSRGTQLVCYGEPRRGPSGVEMVHPEYRRLPDTEQPAATQGALTPIYPTTSGVRQASLLKLTQQALDNYLTRLPDYLPAPIRERFGLPPLHDALREVHRPLPSTDSDALHIGSHPAVRRLALEEMLAHHLGLRRQRQARRAQFGYPIIADGSMQGALSGALPFALTLAQRRVIQEINRDLGHDYPMMRLLQGDVGSGKTLVAAMAAVQTAQASMQAAVMAPTELLAEQHFHNFSRWLNPIGVKVYWLTGRHQGRVRRNTLAAIASGAAQVVIGTHALFQERIVFDRLALVVVDEQHKFGVHQRLHLRQKGALSDRRPHQLIMTATPIPRSLAMTFYADLDTSVIDELPPGRGPVETVAVSSQRRGEVIERIAAACRAARQAYWVCPLVEESDTLDLQAAESTQTRLAAALPELRVGLLHGRMKPLEKQRVMVRFMSREIDLLVATTVIEVGVDVPNASLMIIENAERFGLAQLHQLRGRVGRGTQASTCVLVYDAPLSEAAQSRLGALRETTDGFDIARRDLAIRGPGELLGTRQTGSVAMHIADITRDAALLPMVRDIGRIVEKQPRIVDNLIERWIGTETEVAEV